MRAPYEKGWFIVSRGWSKLPYFKPEPFTDREAYLWSIEQAAFKEHPQWFNGSAYHVERGQFVTSHHAMAVALGWGEKRARLFMGRMVKAGLWALSGAFKGAKAPTVITVCNYEQLQSPSKAPKQGEGESGALSPAKEGRSEGVGATKAGRFWVEEQKHLKTMMNEWPSQGNWGTPRSERFADREAEATKAWNAAAKESGWPQVRLPLATARQEKLRNLLNAETLDGWTAVVKRAQSSTYLGCGDPPRWFRFDWLVEPENFQNVQEGTHDESFVEY